MSVRTDTTQEQEWPSATFGWLWVTVCVFAYISSYLDRQILSLMVDSIKADLSITDSQFGLLHGLSFAILYCVAGLSLGGLIDRFPRRTIVICGVIVWSAMTAVCGFSRQYWQLFLARVGVGVGEATLSPSAYSLLADCFEPKRLGRAISVYFAGGGIGAGLAYLVGGALIGWIDGLTPIALPVLESMRGWQIVFLVVALPGLPVAFAMYLLREPARRGKKETAAPPPGWSDLFQFLGARWHFMVPFFLGMSCVAGVTLGTLSWAPAVVMRSYDLSASEAGLQLGIVTIIAIPMGLMFGAWLAETLEHRNFREPAMLVCFLGVLVLIGATAWMALAPTRITLMSAIFLTLALSNIPYGIATATLQTLVPNEMRGRTSALLLLCQNGLGMILGPLLPGVINDQVFGGDGPSIAIALSATLFVFAVLSTLLLGPAYLRLRTHGRGAA